MIESGILKRVVRSGSIGRYQAETTALVLFPYEVKNNEARLYTPTEIENKFPLAWKYLLKNRALLEQREKGAFEDKQWYRFGRTQNLGMWEQPKLLIPYMITDLSAYLDSSDNFYFINVTTGGYGITTNGEHGSLAYLCALINSPPLNFFFKRISTNFHGGYFAANKQFIEPLPIPESNEQQRQVVEKVVREILWLNARKTAREDLRETTGVPLVAAFMEQWVNALVYELFFPQELHAAGLHFLDLIHAANLPSLETLTEAERLPRLQAIFKTTYAPDHKLRQALYQLGSLDLVRTIEGKA